jgi:hypothetical protein
MKQRNIYKTDDILIIGSFLMLIPPIYLSWPWLSLLPQAEDIVLWLQSAPTFLGSQFSLILLSLGGALTAQVIGRLIRKMEKRTLDILDTLMYMDHTTVAQVARNLNFSEKKVRKLTRKLTRIRGLNIKMEGDNITRTIEASSFTQHTSTVPPQETATPFEQQSNESPSPSPNQFKEETKTETFSFDMNNLSPELQEYMKNDKSNLIVKMKKFRRIAEKGGKITIEELEKTGPVSKEETKKMKGLTILMFILFMTPLWPVALITILAIALKGYKKFKSFTPTEKDS